MRTNSIAIVAAPRRSQPYSLRFRFRLCIDQSSVNSHLFDVMEFVGEAWVMNSPGSGHSKCWRQSVFMWWRNEGPLSTQSRCIKIWISFEHYLVDHSPAHFLR